MRQTRFHKSSSSEAIAQRVRDIVNFGSNLSAWERQFIRTVVNRDPARLSSKQIGIIDRIHLDKVK